MKTKISFLVIAGILVLGMTAFAHHSIIGTYQFDKEVKLEAKIVGVQLRNPHSFIQIEAPDENGVQQRWSMEWGGQLQRLPYCEQP